MGIGMKRANHGKAAGKGREEPLQISVPAGFKSLWAMVFHLQTGSWKNLIFSLKKRDYKNKWEIIEKPIALFGNIW